MFSLFKKKDEDKSAIIRNALWNRLENEHKEFAIANNTPEVKSLVFEAFITHAHQSVDICTSFFDWEKFIPFIRSRRGLVNFRILCDNPMDDFGTVKSQKRSHPEIEFIVMDNDSFFVETDETTGCHMGFVYPGSPSSIGFSKKLVNIFTSEWETDALHLTADEFIGMAYGEYRRILSAIDTNPSISKATFTVDENDNMRIEIFGHRKNGKALKTFESDMKRDIDFGPVYGRLHDIVEKLVKNNGKD